MLEGEWRAAASELGVTLATTTSGGTDHQAFREAGFPAVGLTEEYVGGDSSPHIHAATDTATTVEPYLDYLALAAQLTTLVVLEEVAP
jgi:Zn-dependent M28 family amino/carboxypeptidase